MLIDDTLLERDRTRAHVAAPVGRPRRSRVVLVGSVAACLIVGLVGLVAIERRGTGPAVSDVAFTALDDLPADEWVAFPELPITERFQHAAVATNDGIFVWGGCCEPDTWDDPNSTPFHDGTYFDVNEGTWKVLPDAPLGADRGDAVAAWTGSNVIVVNGDGELRAAALDPATFTWTMISAPDGDTAASAVADLYPLDGGRVAFVITNYEDGLGNGVGIQIYDPSADQWAAAPAPRKELMYGVAVPDTVHGSAISGTQIGVVSTGASCGTVTLDAFDTTTRTWRTIDDVAHPDGAWAPSAVAGLGDGTFLVIGGPCSDGDSQHLAVRVDPANSRHTIMADAPVDVRGGFRYPMTWTGDHVIYLSADGRLVMFDPETDTWTTSEPMPRPAGAAIDGPVHDFPIVWIDGTVIAPAIAIGAERNVCCQPVRAAWSYRPAWSTTPG